VLELPPVFTITKVYTSELAITDMQNEKVALVTGSSSGIGLETAVMLSNAGFKTYASMRNLDKSKNIREIANKDNLPLHVIQLDVSDDGSVRDAITKIVTAEKRIDVLVNNAGYGLFGSVEDMSMEEIKAQFETNFFGVVRVTQQVLPVMRKQRSGKIVNVSSVGGRIGLPVLSAYHSTKFALEGLSESIAFELEPFGIRVIIIEPGVIRTNIINSSISAKKGQDPKSPYFSLTQNLDNSFKTMMASPTSLHPQEVAKVILEAVSSENPHLRYTVGDDADVLLRARKDLSDIEFRTMIKKNFSR
jgi:NAD(P)-dependent dehydrogenase (short-subunit alcohol dehydrogenase family)